MDVSAASMAAEDELASYSSLHKRRSLVISKVKLVSLVVLLVASVGAVGSSLALALPTEGPFWQVNNTKLPVGATRAVGGNIVPGTVGILFSRVAGKLIENVCKKFTPTVSIFNSTQHGEGLGKSVYEECIVRENGVQIKECEVNPEAKPKNSVTTEEVKGSLWYSVTNLGKTRTALERGLFVPKTGKAFLRVELVGPGCGSLEGSYKQEGSVVSIGSPENTEVETGKATFPTEQQKHLWQPKNSPEETQAELLFNTTEAMLRGEGELRLKSGEKFGVIE
jgi:hypothetical protein